MTLPTGRYAAEGPPVPPDGMPDSAPLRIIHINELDHRNGLGEAIFLVDAWGMDGRDHVIIKLILGVNPHTGEITRAAVMMRAGDGYITCDPLLVPGNLRDIVTTIALDPRPTP